METNIIYCGECAETMKLHIPDNSIDLTVTSPPYDNLRTYKGYVFPFEDIAKELFRVTKQGGVVVWVVADATIKGSETGTSFRQALYFKEIGFNLHDTMIYGKVNWVPLTHKRYEQQFEYMFVFSKGKPITFNPLSVVSKHKGKIPFGTFRHNGDDVKGKAHSISPVKDTKRPGNIFMYDVGYMKTTKDKFA
jgi:site-specific DNA-methyltransferase (adenine-specific)